LAIEMGLALGLAIGGPAALRAEEMGIDSPFYFPPIGCGGPEGFENGCHLQLADPELTVSLTGPPAIDVGGVGVFEASVPSAFAGCGPTFDLACQGAGINVKLGDASTTTCDLDTFAAPNLQLLASPSSLGGNVISHTDATSPVPNGNIGAFAYTFLLTNCDVPGNIVLLAAMNAFDGSGDETGEAWNQAQLEVTVPEPGAGPAAAAGAIALLALVRRRRGAFMILYLRAPGAKRPRAMLAGCWIASSANSRDPKGRSATSPAGSWCARTGAPTPGSSTSSGPGPATA